MQVRASKFKAENLEPAVVPKAARRSTREQEHGAAQVEEMSNFSLFGRWTSYVYRRVRDIEYPSGEKMLKFGSEAENMRTDEGTMIEVIQFIYEHSLNNTQREQDAIYSLESILYQGIPWNVDDSVIEDIISIGKTKDEGSDLFDDVYGASIDVDDETLGDIRDYATWSSALLELEDMAKRGSRIPWDIWRGAMIDLKDAYMKRINEEEIVPSGTDIGKPCPSCRHTSISMRTKQIRSIDEGASDLYICCKCKATRYDVNLLSFMHKK